MSDMQKISLAREYLDEKNCSEQEILNFFKRASNEFKGEIELAAVRKKILG